MMRIGTQRAWVMACPHMFQTFPVLDHKSAFSSFSPQMLEGTRPLLFFLAAFQIVSVTIAAGNRWHV